MKLELALNLAQKPYPRILEVSHGPDISWENIIGVLNHAREFGTAQMVHQNLHKSDEAKMIKTIKDFVAATNLNGCEIEVHRHSCKKAPSGIDCLVLIHNLVRKDK